MSKMIIGRYLQGDSFIHNLDPRTKISITFLYIILVFLANNPASYLLLILYMLLAIALSKIKLKHFIRGVRPMIALILFTVLFQVFFTKGDQVIWQWWILTLTKEGLINAVYVFLRLVLVVFMSTMLTLTTSPIKLTDGIESLLKPLEKLKLPIHELAMILSIALRFIPTLSDEAVKIMDAQKSRGVDFEEGSLLQRLKAFIPVLIPLFVSAFTRAEEMAVAMEARGYRGAEGRTSYHQLKFNSHDVIVIVATILLLVGLIILRN